MKPYFSTPNGVLYNCDCLDIMPELEPVELCLTDPPYGIGEATGKNTSRGSSAGANKWKGTRNTTGVGVASTKFDVMSWDNVIPSPETFKAIQDYSTHQIIFGGNYFVEYLKNSPCWLVWDKDNGTTDFADCEQAWTNFESAVRKFKYRWNGMLQENAGKHKEKRYHPTQKPVGLFMQILLSYAKPGWTILDPFAGSGTTGMACERLPELNLKYVLIEREEKYCEIIAKRITLETQQQKLPGF